MRVKATPSLLVQATFRHGTDGLYRLAMVGYRPAEIRAVAARCVRLGLLDYESSADHPYLTNEGEAFREELHARMRRLSTVIAGSSCREWLAHLDSTGYGRIQVLGRLAYTHREMFQHHHGPIPAPLVIDHTCRNRACCNPNHLEPVTPITNTRRGVGHGSEARCPRGHLYEGSNLAKHTDGRGYTRRLCRACRQANRRVPADRAREAAASTAPQRAVL